MANQTNTTMGEYTMNSIKHLMKIHYQSRVPMLLIGMPGVGKTEIIEETANELLNVDKYVDEYLELPKRQPNGKIAVDKNNQPVLEKTPVYITQPDGKTPLTTKNGEKIIRQVRNYPTSKDGFTAIDCSSIGDDGYSIPYLNQYNKENPLQRAMLPEFNALRDWLNDPANNGKRAIFFIDEFTSASQDDQRTLMNFINSGIFPDGTRFDVDRVFFVLAGNPSSSMPGYSEYDGATNDIEQAVITRCMTYFVKADLEEFIKWGSEFDANGRHNIHPYLISALEHDPKMFMKADSDLDVRVMNPRTLKKLSDYLYTCNDLFNKTHDSQYKWERAAIEAAVGKPAANSLIKTLNDLDNTISIKELLNIDKKNSKTLNKELAKIFEKLPAFQQTYLALLAVDDVMGIDYSQVNNYLKLIQMLRLNFQTREAGSAILNTTFNSAKNSKTAATILEVGLNPEKYDIPEEYGLDKLVTENAKKAVNLQRSLAD